MNLVKHSAESKVYYFDFGNDALIKPTGGDTLMGTPVVTATPVDGSLVIGAPNIGTGTETGKQNAQVNVRISGGVKGTFYDVICTCGTNNAPNAVEMRFTLEIDY